MIVDIFVLFIFGIGSMAQKVLRNNGGGNGINRFLTLFTANIVKIQRRMCTHRGATFIPQFQGLIALLGKNTQTEPHSSRSSNQFNPLSAPDHHSSETRGIRRPKYRNTNRLPMKYHPARAGIGRRCANREPEW